MPLLHDPAHDLYGLLDCTAIFERRADASDRPPRLGPRPFGCIGKRRFPNYHILPGRSEGIHSRFPCKVPTAEELLNSGNRYHNLADCDFRLDSLGFVHLLPRDFVLVLVQEYL